uniref:DNA-directed RNA polymerase RpoA/D/Rpb3-type domain-containing protein n=1 Tax=Aegilops tauschii subsp. strangulata TaxID=200361 RepID=A0A452YZR0_AEGTS
LQFCSIYMLCHDCPVTEGFQYSGAFAAMGVDTSVSVEKFCKNFKIEINRLTDEDMEFDMIGVDASIANAFRRILIAEVPTMAIEKVFMVDNTSVIADEVLSHRLGLIPLDADPRLFDYISDDVPNERNTIVYKLHVSCEKGSQRLTGIYSLPASWILVQFPIILPFSYWELCPFKSGQLEWLPEGSQLTMASPAQSGDNQRTYTSFGQSQQNTSERPLGVKYNDITIARLGPGQVVLLKEIKNGDAEELVKRCPVNVFDIEDLGKVTIESTGALPPEVLFTEAVKILEEKCERVISELS